jgi:hypothetical protein
MTRKYFEMIAQAVDSLTRDGIIHPAESIAVAFRFADAIEGTNPNFNRERFLEAATKSLDTVTPTNHTGPGCEPYINELVPASNRY